LTQKNTNDRLEEKKRLQEIEVQQMVKGIKQFQTEMQNKSMSLNNELAKKSDQLKEMEA